ncbi:MAG: sigma-54 dependent transcriptional regulator [Holophagae bacterium]|jgi:DNA-binding NtrC family response regulator
MTDTLLVIEDEDLLADELGRHFRNGGWEVVRAATIEEADDLLLERNLEPLVVLSDMSLPDGNALDLFERARDRDVGGEWVLLTAYGTIPDSVRALRLGAVDFLEKPCPTERLDLVVASAARSARAQLRLRNQAKSQNRRYCPDAFVGSSRASRELRAMIRRLAEVPFTACILAGETGTGKGLAARILHSSGIRSDGPLVEINCAAIPRELLESELLGHEAGAFTGAKGRHRGVFEQAHQGTLFLDEIGELGSDLQAKLLKVIEEQRVRRLGGEREVTVDVQVIAASNHDLASLVASGAFRSDLYHRLSVFVLEIPPLRDRIDDLDELVPLFLDEFNAVAGRRVRRVADEAWSALRQHDWPGNVRELRNAIERGVLLADGDTLGLRWLHLSTHRGVPAPTPETDDGGGLRLPLDGSMTLDEMDAAIIKEALRRTNGNVSATARALGVTRQTLRYRIDKFGIDPSQ